MLEPSSSEKKVGHDNDACLLDVIVVTYNSWNSASSELIRMVELARLFRLIRWTFVDNSPNAADAANLERISLDVDNVNVYRSPGNPGFAASCNAAASRSKADWVLFLNPDIMINSQDLESVITEIRKDTSVDSIAISQVTHGMCHSGVGITRYMWFVDRPKGSRLPLIGPSGGAGVFRRETFSELGGFFEPLFAWGEDADLAMRLRSVGGNCVELDLQLKHQGQHSLNDGRAAHSFKARLLARNRLWVAARNLPQTRAILFAIVTGFIFFLQSPRNISRGTFIATWRGYWDGILKIQRAQSGS